ncbi:MAG: hypothetical protein K2M46_13620 [Lachnospiraceae bacterium]|nr:hypothetical protein [Lachnospiraceae bacterium]
MTFTTIRFCLFFAVVFVIYTCCTQRYRKYLLFMANVLFYLSLDVKVSLLAFFTALVTFFGGRQIEKYKNTDRKRAKSYLLAVIATVLLILFLGKYLNFLTETIQKVMDLFHVSARLPVFELLAWIGISYYSLKAVSYLVDVYQGKIQGETDVILFVNYLLFFPQIVAGPIGRAEKMLPQLRKSLPVTKEQAALALNQLATGYFKKLVIANMAAGYVDKVYADVASKSGLTCLFAAFLYSMQIYCDFSGYSDISIGVSGLLGISVEENFNCPYMAKSIKEFWRRWHISLSAFLVDYVYIPLGGSREGKGKKIRNTLLTFLLSGLWHGASWTFVFWGLYHGVCNCFCKGIEKKRNIPKILATFCLVTVGWLFFRADSFSTAFLMLKNIAVNTTLSVTAIQETLLVFTGDMMSLAYGLMALVMTGLLLLREYRYTYGGLSENNSEKKKAFAGKSLQERREREQVIWLAFCIFSIICMGDFGSQGFIYANF